MTPRDEAWYKLGYTEGQLSATLLIDTTAVQKQALNNALDEIEKIESDAPRTVYVSAVKDIICSCRKIHHVTAKLEVLDNMDAKYTIEGE